MKLCIQLIGAGLLVSSTAFAQTEQWLQYHTGEGRGYHQLQVTSKAPTNVALPKLSGQAWFAKWTTPMDPSGGRWICFDRTRKSGPFDRVYVDSNGNGRLDDDKPVIGKTESNTAIFAPTPIVFKGEDGPVTYHLAFRFYTYDNSDPTVLMASAGWYEGMVNFDGVKRRVQLVDGNVNGTFSDMAADPYQSDRIQIDGEKTSERFLGRMVEVGGKFFKIEVARDGAFVKVSKTDVVLGSMHVQEDICDFGAFGENGHFVRKPQNGDFTLPVGKYRFVTWEITRKDEKGTPWTLSGNRFPDTATFEVVADKPAKLDIGEPVKAALKVNEGAERNLAFSLTFVGRQNESVDISRDGQNPPRPKLTVASADGSLHYTNSFEFG